MSIGGSLVVATLAVVLAGCGGATGTGTSFPASGGAPTSESPAVAPLPVEVLLPSVLGGVELHTFPVGRDSVARLLAKLGVPPTEFEIAYASDHGSRFLQLYALRVRGMQGGALLDAFAAAAYDLEAGRIERSVEEIAGRAVSVFNQPATAQRLGTFYAYTLDDVPLVAQALDRQTAVDGLAGLP